MSDLSATAPRKPRIALMGEFSAGKSTLTNLLLGSHPLPVKVTATRLPPVRISYGPARAEVALRDGSHAEIAPTALDTVALDTARHINLFLPSEALELCELIDMPGISDPNMPAELWQAVLPEVDGVIWCTSAPQAWRQSEAAFWSILAPKLRGPALLLVTHFDKLTSERDRSRVLRRLERETDGSFEAIFPIALPQALSAGDDMEVWKTSGADRFVEHLIDLLLKWQNEQEVCEQDDAIRKEAADTAVPPLDVSDLAALAPVPDLRRRSLRVLTSEAPPAEAAANLPGLPDLAEDTAAQSEAAAPQSVAEDGGKVLPRRVRPMVETPSPRPRRSRLTRTAP